MGKIAGLFGDGAVRFMSVSWMRWLRGLPDVVYPAEGGTVAWGVRMPADDA
jgi:hypothetical protein